MKFSKVMFLMLFIYGLAAIIFALTPSQETSATFSEKQIDLALNPEDILINVSNIKPGDQIVQDLAVMNSGNVNFHYHVRAGHKAESEKLFNQLLLRIADANNTVLYEGKMSGFTGFQSPRYLSYQSEETLTFTAELPWETGNDFQGLRTVGELIFSVEEVPTVTSWDKSSLKFLGQTGNCDVIQATLQNGNDSQDMQGGVRYEIYWIAKGNPKNGQMIHQGTVQPLKNGETVVLQYNPKDNPNGASGNYMFKAYQREGHPGKGELWSEQVSIECN